ncbi:MAG: SBBP repeat-containing protein [Deltaproteobacteria bacterium]|nr:SBBP repeat-containing protein [Deltaproteobacteria bacterium]
MRWKISVAVMSFLFLLLPHYAGAQVAIEKWIRTYDGAVHGNDKVIAVSLDPWGNVYVTGTSWGENSDYATIKYDTNGNQLWVKRYDNGYWAMPDVPSALVVDSFGNVYVTGTTATLKYDTNGNELWVKDGGNAIAVDFSGNIYVAKSSIGPSGGNDYATIKYDANGNEVWVKWYGGLWSDYPFGLALDTSGNICVTGYSDSSSGGFDFATVKYDPNGNELWARRYDGGFEDRPAALLVDSSGNIYIAGRSENAGGWNDYTTIKYDTNGNEQWIRNYDAGYGYEDLAEAIMVDATGNVYVTGSSDNSNRVANIVTVKYDVNGSLQWTTRYDSGNNGEKPSAMAMDVDSGIYITGRIQPVNMPTNVVTIKYDTGGNEKWVRTFDGGSADESSDIAVDAAGAVYVTGTTYSDIGGYDYLTMKYTQKGR